jgi:hypothetical protein
MEALFEEDYNRNRTQYRMFQQARRRREAGILTPARQLLASTVIPLVPTVGSERARAASLPVGPPVPSRPVSPWPTTIQETVTDVESLLTLLGVQGLNTLYTQLAGTVAEETNVPTAAVIQEASMVTSLEPPADVECSICQDHAGPNNQTEWRILRHCNHRFHRSCIDTWFQRNAHCPVCRHDIRQTF